MQRGRCHVLSGCIPPPTPIISIDSSDITVDGLVTSRESSSLSSPLHCRLHHILLIWPMLSLSVTIPFSPKGQDLCFVQMKMIRGCENYEATIMDERCSGVPYTRYSPIKWKSHETGFSLAQYTDTRDGIKRYSRSVRDTTSTNY